MSLAVPVLLLAACLLALVIVLARIRSRRPEVWVPPPRPAPREPTREEHIRMGMAHQATAAFTDWWRGELDEACPGCETRSSALVTTSDRHHVAPALGRPGFVAWTVTLACEGCGWQLSFPHTDSPPSVRPVVRLHREPVPGPRRAWPVRAAATGEVGEIELGGGLAPRIQVAPGAREATRATLTACGAILRGILRVDASELGDAEALAVACDVARGRLPFHGGELAGEPALAPSEPRTCARCQTPVPPDPGRYCTRCGAPFEPERPAPSGAPSGA